MLEPLREGSLSAISPEMSITIGSYIISSQSNILIAYAILHQIAILYEFAAAKSMESN